MMPLAFVLISAICLAQTADPRIGPILAELASVHNFDQVAISPDGKHAAWIEADTIHISDLTAKVAPARIACPKPCSQRDLAWSPDNSAIAFLSDREKKGQMQLYLA